MRQSKPGPGRTEARRQAYRKAQARYRFNAIGCVFAGAVPDLGAAEASRLLLEWAQENAERYKAKGRGRAKSRTGLSKQAEDEYLSMVAEDTGSPRRAAELVERWHGKGTFGNSIEAIEQRIDRLLRARRKSQA
jgi:hypothetical protein